MREANGAEQKVALDLFKLILLVWTIETVKANRSSRDTLQH